MRAGTFYGVVELFFSLVDAEKWSMQKLFCRRHLLSPNGVCQGRRMAIIHSHKQLIVWQRAMQLVEAVYEVTDKFPKDELYRLTAQMRSSATSIPFNIAEGRKRRTRKDYRRFLNMAYSSGGELESQLEISKRLPFGKHLDFSKADALLEEVMKMLNVILRKM